MNETLAVVVGMPALFTVILIVGRALARSAVHVLPNSAFSKLKNHENIFDWAAHIGFGSTILAALTVLGLAAVDRPHPAVGIFAGPVAAVIAFVFLRPPVRPNARNPEIDGPLIATSIGVHITIGFLLAGVLVSGSGI